MVKPSLLTPPSKEGSRRRNTGWGQLGQVVPSCLGTGGSWATLGVCLGLGRGSLPPLDSG